MAWYCIVFDMIAVYFMSPHCILWYGMVLYFIWSYCTVSHCYVPLLKRAGELPRSASSHFSATRITCFRQSYLKDTRVSVSLCVNGACNPLLRCKHQLHLSDSPSEFLLGINTDPHLLRLAHVRSLIFQISLLHGI